MTGLIAIDPGYGRTSRGCACALFVRDVLASTWYDAPAKPHTQTLAGAPIGSRVVWELPQDDARNRGRGADTLIRLAAVGGELAGIYAGALSGNVRAIPAGEWTGGTPKPVRHGRLWRVLNDAERAILGGAATLAAIDAAKEAGALERWSRPGVAYYPARFHMHNILDAVALGCWSLGRRA